MLRSGNGVAPRQVHNQNPSLGRCLNINVVDPCASPSDNPQSRTSVDRGSIDEVVGVHNNASERLDNVSKGTRFMFGLMIYIATSRFQDFDATAF
jgi:hypothetical protein